MKYNYSNDTMKIKIIHKKKQQLTFQGFSLKISKFIPALENFTRLKIQISKNECSCEKRFYSVNDILDDVYLQVFSSKSKELNEEYLHRILFRKTILKLNNLKKDIKKHQNSISKRAYLKEELDSFEENCFDKKNFKPIHFILNEVLENQLIGKFFNKNYALILLEHRKEIPKIYHSRPENIGIILELHVFANQSPTQISNILGVDSDTIHMIISKFLNEFKEIQKN